MVITLRPIFFIFCREPKNRHVVLQTSNDRNSTKNASRPSIIANRNRRIRRFPVYKEQHRAAPFQRLFDLFCREPKNRHFTSQTSNARSSIQHPFPYLYHSTIQSSRSPLPRHSTHSNARRRFITILAYFVRRPKIKTSPKRNNRASRSNTRRGNHMALRAPRRGHHMGHTDICSVLASYR